MAEDAQRITLTIDLLRLARTRRGGYTREQLEILGLSWPPSPGWVKKVVGRRLTGDQLEQLFNAGTRGEQ